MKLDYRTFVWSLGALFAYTLVLVEVSRLFELQWSYMRWFALLGDVLAFFVGFTLDQYYKVKDAEKREATE